MDENTTAAGASLPAVPKAAGSRTLKVATGSRNEQWGANLVNRTMSTLPGKYRKNGDDKVDSIVNLSIDSLAAFKPTDPIEGMIASQAVALHNASLECFRRAMIPEQPAEIAAKLRKDGTNMSRAMVDMVEALARHRGKGPQVVRVERVMIGDGGQAIVGNVTHGPQPLAIGTGSQPMAMAELKIEEAEKEGEGR